MGNICPPFCTGRVGLSTLPIGGPARRRVITMTATARGLTTSYRQPRGNAAVMRSQPWHPPCTSSRREDSMRKTVLSIVALAALGLMPSAGPAAAADVKVGITIDVPPPPVVLAPPPLVLVTGTPVHHVPSA